MTAEQATMFCLKCGYVLDNLPEPRCPECGQPFDPYDSQTYWDSASVWLRPVRAWLGWLLPSPLFVVPLVWCVAYVFGAAVMVLVVAGACVNVVRRRWISALAILVLTPQAYYSGEAVSDYLHDEGRLRDHGLPGIESNNTHPVYRCEMAVGGCLVDGHTELEDIFYNMTLEWLIRSFGHMEGCYEGPYPTREACVAALEHGEPITRMDLRSDNIPLSSGAVRLDPGVGRSLIETPAMYEWVFSEIEPGGIEALQEKIGPIAAVMCQGCLLIRIPSLEHTERRGVPSGLITVIDPSAGRPFAYYQQGDYHQVGVGERWRK